MSTLRNLVRNTVRSGWGKVMLAKATVRVRERTSKAMLYEVRDWCRANAIDTEDWARSLDPELWLESKKFASEQHAMAVTKLRALDCDLGGGGAYDLLYFLTCLLKPEIVVETGVAAGFSSRALLSALHRNGSGTLYSSDFPYFRLDDPERFIGFIVEPELRKGWHLKTAGDKANLPDIASRVDRVDLFHYDSDKSTAGRSFAFETLGPLITKDTLVIYDDIQDNPHFMTLMENLGCPFEVFKFEGKWLGMFGGPDRLGLFERKSRIQPV